MIGADERRFAVLVGNGKFPDDTALHELKCPSNDVEGMRATISAEYSGNFDQVHVLVDKTSSEILRKLNRIINETSRNDLLLVFYAGHGKLDKAGRLHLASFETLEKELPTSSVPVERIRDLIDSSNLTKAAIFLDCCYSGAIESAFLRGSVNDQLQSLSGGRGIFIMTASTARQTAREEETEGGLGIFTRSVIEGLKGAADRDGDGLVSMNELYQYVHRNVTSQSSQEPMKWDLGSKGELIIASTGRKPREERRKAVRQHVLKMLHDDVIPESIALKVMRIASLSQSEIIENALELHERLTDNLVSGQISVARFINDWILIKNIAVDNQIEQYDEALSTNVISMNVTSVVDEDEADVIALSNSIENLNLPRIKLLPSLKVAGWLASSLAASIIAILVLVFGLVAMYDLWLK